MNVMGHGKRSKDNILHEARHKVAIELGYRSWSELRTKADVGDKLLAHSEVSDRLAQELKENKYS